MQVSIMETKSVNLGENQQNDKVSPKERIELHDRPFVLRAITHTWTRKQRESSRHISTPAQKGLAIKDPPGS